MVSWTARNGAWLKSSLGWRREGANALRGLRVGLTLDCGFLRIIEVSHRSTLSGCPASEKPRLGKGLDKPCLL
jgi:hypothetical protein